MTTAELFGIAGACLSALLSLVILLIGVIYRNDEKARETTRSEFLARITALEKQNTEQETKIATIIANASNHDYAMERVTREVEKLGDKIDAMNMFMQQVLGRKATPPPFSPQR